MCLVLFKLSADRRAAASKNPSEDFKLSKNTHASINIDAQNRTRAKLMLHNLPETYNSYYIYAILPFKALLCLAEAATLGLNKKGGIW